MAVSDWDYNMLKLTALGLMMLMTGASACTAHGNATQNDVGLLCTARGTNMLRPAISDQAVCAMFQTKIDAALTRKIIAVNSVSLVEPADWIKIDVRFLKPGTASATVVQRISGKETAHPEIAVDVMDKFMGPNDVGTLASAVAKYLAETPKH